MQSLTTLGITITVKSFYQAEHSNPINNDFLFAYKIEIKNNNNYPVKLLRRSWHILQADGVVRLVEGEGVVGLQPTIVSGALHQYFSGCNLNTEFGSMKGTYQMINLNNNQIFNVEIPEFILIAPFKLN